MKITLKRLACLGASFTSALAMADAAGPPVLLAAIPHDVTATPPSLWTACKTISTCFRGRRSSP